MNRISPNERICSDIDCVSDYCIKGQIITWSGQVVRNNSLVTLSVVSNRISTSYPPQYPLVCQGITGGQWYELNGVLFPLATPDPVSTPGGLGQRNVSGGVELYRGAPSVFPHGVQCCTNTTITLCVGMYSDPATAASVSLTGYNNALSVAATYGPNITGGVQFQMLTLANVEPPVFQLTCTSTSSPPTDIRPTSTYNNTLTVTGRAYGMYTCTVTTTCSPVYFCGGFTLNPRSTTSSLPVQTPPGPPTGGTAVQSGPTSVSVSWTAPTSGGPARYDIYYVANGGPSTSGGSTYSTSYVLTNLQAGVQYNISVIAVGTSLPSLSANVILNTPPGPVGGLQAFNKTFTTITLTWQPPPVPNGVIIMYQVTYSTNGMYNTATPPVIITGLVPRTTYTFSVTAYTITGLGTLQQVQTSTADIPNVTGVVVSAINTTSVRVSWLAVQLPPVGILTGYTVYYLSLPNTSKRQSGGYTSHTFSLTTTSGDINNLNPNGAYQFSVVAQVTITGQLYSGEIDTSLVNTPTITPGSSNLVSTCNCGGVLAGSLVAEFVVLAVAMTAGFITLMSLSGTRNDANDCGHISNCTNVMIREGFADKAWCDHCHKPFVKENSTLLRDLQRHHKKELHDGVAHEEISTTLAHNESTLKSKKGHIEQFFQPSLYPSLILRTTRCSNATAGTGMISLKMMKTMLQYCHSQKHRRFEDCDFLDADEEMDHNSASAAQANESNDLRREVKDEFGAWLSVPETRQVNATSPIDPLAWWKLHDSRFPRISKLARKYLAIPASSAPSERVFSRAKLIQQRQSWNLLPQRLEASIMFKHNAWILNS
ncbi:hypothetical protein EMCRGX_G019124 [Ephydatia muelleri]